MKGYLIGHIALLLFLGAAILIAPVAAVLAIPLYLIGTSIYNFFSSLTTTSKNDVAMFFGSILLFFIAILVGNKLTNLLWYETFTVVATCVIVILCGVKSRGIASAEKRKYYMNDAIGACTGIYPILLIASALLRLFAVAAVSLFEMDAALQPPLSTVGYIVFAVAILMYILRTVHIFLQNNY